MSWELDNEDSLFTAKYSRQIDRSSALSKKSDFENNFERYVQARMLEERVSEFKSVLGMRQCCYKTRLINLVSSDEETDEEEQGVEDKDEEVGDKE